MLLAWYVKTSGTLPLHPGCVSLCVFEVLWTMEQYQHRLGRCQNTALHFHVRIPDTGKLGTLRRKKFSCTMTARPMMDLAED